jgi:N-acetylglucosamine-6-phosphate deacetylase
MIALTADRFFGATDAIERTILLVDGGKITSIASRDRQPISAGARHLDFPGCWIVPGYIDLHIHGSAGFDVMSSDPASLPAIERFIARHGTVGYLPTTVTAPMDATLRALERLAERIEARGTNDKRARPLGIHLEGPFISHARRGVHPERDLLEPSIRAFDQLWQAASGHIKMMTIAPELDNAPEVIAAAAKRGVLVSLGHSNADLEATRRGIAAGARHATHTFNAMRPLDHRDPGILGEVLTNGQVSADVIADGIHVDPSVVKLLAEAKGRDTTVLITDATAATGMPDGVYTLGDLAVEVKDGKCTRDGKLAGSVLTIDRAVRNLADFAGWTMEESVAAASRNPARVAGLTNSGVLKVGADADFVVLRPNGEIERTFIGGEEC